MRRYVKSIIMENDEIREKFNIIDVSLQIKNIKGKEEELIITPEGKCYLADDSSSIADFISSYVEVEDYNEGLYRAVIECEFRMRYYAYLQDYYMSLKTGVKVEKELDSYKDKYINERETTKELRAKINELEYTIYNLNSENNKLKGRIKYYEECERERNTQKNDKEDSFDEFNNLFRNTDLDGILSAVLKNIFMESRNR